MQRIGKTITKRRNSCIITDRNWILTNHLDHPLLWFAKIRERSRTNPNEAFSFVELYIDCYHASLYSSAVPKFHMNDDWCYVHPETRRFSAHVWFVNFLLLLLLLLSNDSIRVWIFKLKATWKSLYRIRIEFSLLTLKASNKQIKTLWCCVHSAVTIYVYRYWWNWHKYHKFMPHLIFQSLNERKKKPQHSFIIFALHSSPRPNVVWWKMVWCERKKNSLITHNGKICIFRRWNKRFEFRIRNLHSNSHILSVMLNTTTIAIDTKITHQLRSVEIMEQKTFVMEHY